MEPNPQRTQEPRVCGVADRLSAGERACREIEPDDREQTRERDHRNLPGNATLDAGHGRRGQPGSLPHVADAQAAIGPSDPQLAPELRDGLSASTRPAIGGSLPGNHDPMMMARDLLALIRASAPPAARRSRPASPLGTNR